MSLNWAIIGTGIYLWPVQCKVIIRNIADILLIGPQGTKSKKFIYIIYLFIAFFILEVVSTKSRPFCLGFSVLRNHISEYFLQISAVFLLERNESTMELFLQTYFNQSSSIFISNRPAMTCIFVNILNVNSAQATALIFVSRMDVVEVFEKQSASNQGEN